MIGRYRDAIPVDRLDWKTSRPAAAVIEDRQVGSR